MAAKILGRANLPTRFGLFEAVAFDTADGLEHLALVRGNVRDASAVPVRIHSECLTGDTLGSLRCDCRDQLETAIAFLGREPVGVLLYLRQEGRGIGLSNKILAYALQDHGMDTVEANHALGFREDERTYDIAADMLRALRVASVVLLTNNPAKIEGLERHNVRVVGRAPIVVPPNPHNAPYIETKRLKMGHLLGPADTPAALEGALADGPTAISPGTPGRAAPTPILASASAGGSAAAAEGSRPASDAAEGATHQAPESGSVRLRPRRTGSETRSAAD
ncbi:MAG: GTP cyclohydrolase II [Thermoplasmatota archaeon]